MKRVSTWLEAEHISIIESLTLKLIVDYVDVDHKNIVGTAE